MEVVYGTFSNLEDAHRAARSATARRDVADSAAHVHTHYIANRHLPRQARLPLRYGLAGGLAGGAIGYLLGIVMHGGLQLLGGPAPILEVNELMPAVLALLGAAFGALAGVLAGSAATQRILTRLRSQVQDGHPLVTITAPAGASREILQLMQSNDADVVGVLS